MIRRRYLVPGGAALALGVAAIVWDSAPEEVPAAVAATDALPRPEPRAVATPTPAAPLEPIDLPRRLSSVTSPRSATGSPATAAAQLVTLTASALPEMHVGEQKDLVLGMVGASEVGEVAFTVQFDGSVLQVRSGAEGDWSMVTGGTAQFATDISAGEDRINVRTVLALRRSTAADISIARVQFQAIAPGVSSVMISDVTIKDRAGRAMPFVVSPSILQVTAASGAPPS